MERDLPMTGLESLIRATYIRERECYDRARRSVWGRYKPGPCWDGGYDSQHRWHKPVWPKIAAIVQRERLDAEAFVRRIFRQRPRSAPAPLPNALLSPSALESYRTELPIAEAEIQLALPIQQQACQLEFNKIYRITKWSQTNVWGNVLFNETLSMSALFRYCTAVRVGHRQAAAHYLLDAACQYVIHREIYDRVWGSLIPATFPARAERIYMDLASRQES